MHGRHLLTRLLGAASEYARQRTEADTEPVAPCPELVGHEAEAAGEVAAVEATSRLQRYADEAVSHSGSTRDASHGGQLEAAVDAGVDDTDLEVGLGVA